MLSRSAGTGTIKARSTRVYSLTLAEVEFLQAPALLPDGARAYAGWTNADVLEHVCGAGWRGKPNRAIWDGVSLRSGTRCITWNDAFRASWPKGQPKDWQTFDLATLRGCHEDFACLQLPAWVFDQELRRREAEFFAAVDDAAADFASDCTTDVDAVRFAEGDSDSETTMRDDDQAPTTPAIIDPTHIDCEACGDLREVQDPTVPKHVIHRIPCVACMPRPDAPVVRASDFLDESTARDEVAAAIVEAPAPAVATPLHAVDTSEQTDVTRTVTKEERRAFLGRLEDALDALVAGGAIDRAEHKRRTRAAKDAFLSSCLFRCPGCDVIYGRGMCPRCGKLVSQQIDCNGPAWAEHAAKWDYDALAWRKLAVRFSLDILRLDGPAKSAWDKRAKAPEVDLYAETVASCARLEAEFAALADDADEAELQDAPTPAALAKPAKLSATDRARAAWGRGEPVN